MDALLRCFREAAGFLNREAGLCDLQGRILASTQDHSGLLEQQILNQAIQQGSPVTDKGYTFMPLNPESSHEGVLFLEGEDQEATELIQLLRSWIQSAKLERNKEAEKIVFLKNVLLENELPGDIPLKARDFSIPYHATRQVVLAKFKDPADERAQVVALRHLDISKDTILAIDEYQWVVLLGLDSRGADQLARADVLTAGLQKAYQEEGRDVRLGVGLPKDTLKDTAKSFREASLALVIGEIFQTENQVIRYDRLGLGRLIYQLPPTLCERFLSEVFAPETYESLDPETLLTIDKFFENNLNGSETSRQLFVHRNTLVYRLDKVQKITGLDLRNFDDAVLFKVAAMVRSYLESIHQSSELTTLNTRW